MDMNKTSLLIDGEAKQINFASPIVKIDKANRLVSGYATANNIDSQNDIVTTDASLKAFQNARGNVREMHGPVAVGTVKDYKVDTFVGKDGKTYEGVYVTVYVSKGAPDAWEKVLDGTYTGFSIGGNITDSEPQWNKDAKSAVRIVKGFDLIELSIVDNPANQMANIFTIQKSMTATTNDIELENAFVCRNEEVARTTDADTLKCITCDAEMEYMGWVETAGDMNKAVSTLMNKFLTPATNEGGVTKMTDENKTVDSPLGNEENGITDPEVVEAPSPEGEANETPDEVPAEEPVPVDEPVVNETPNTDEPAIEKMLAEVRESVSQQIAAIEGKIDEVSKAAEVRMDELNGKFSEAMQKFESASSDVEKANKAVEIMVKRLEAVEGKSAIRKSADLESVSVAEEPDNLWSGAFD